MTETLQRPAPRADTVPPAGPTSKGWLGQLLLRLHFYAGILVGPFILIAALSAAGVVVLGLTSIAAAPTSPGRTASM